MSGRAPGDSYWRVSAKGTDAAPRVATDPHWGRDEAVAASFTLPAADEDAARAAATALLARALPSVTWSQIGVTPKGAGRGSRLSEG